MRGRGLQKSKGMRDRLGRLGHPYGGCMVMMRQTPVEGTPTPRACSVPLSYPLEVVTHVVALFSSKHASYLGSGTHDR